MIKQPDIIYEDKDIMVCYKEAGIATQSAGSRSMDMVSLLANYRKNQGEEPYIGLVHRLDQPVEGVMVFGKNKTATANLSKQVQKRSFSKKYYAVVWGMPQEKDTLVDYLKRDGKTNTSKVVSENEPDSKMAKLEYRVLDRKEEQSLLLVLLHTGRHHQIRVQLSSHGCPIVGDRKYGKTTENMGYMPLGLCSCFIQFQHPVTGKEMQFQIDPKGAAFSPFTF
ncbi:MAG: RNA pseudouridine synthase [Lachnospiraceae bacterium]|nr:RNA pseudouridine synthase [Lachnospiraceae bacterium]